MKFIIIALTVLLLCFDNQVYASGQQIAASYDDFEWGTSPDEAQKLARTKGIEDCRVSQDPEDRERGIGDRILFDDMLLDAPVSVVLCFTPKSQKLYEVKISPSLAIFPIGHPNRGKPSFLSTNSEILIRSLDQKYGQHRKQRLVRNVSGHTNLMPDRIEEVFSWGSPDSGTLISITFDPYSPNLHQMAYTNAEMKALCQKEIEDIKEANEQARQQKINNDIGAKL